MGITNSNKELSAARIDCNGSFQVKLSLTAAPDILTSPTDIVLVLDRSQSMAGSALARLKEGAKPLSTFQRGHRRRLRMVKLEPEAASASGTGRQALQIFGGMQPVSCRFVMKKPCLIRNRRPEGRPLQGVALCFTAR